MIRFPAAETLRLTGADCFLRAIDDETRSCNSASHLSQLSLQLGSPRRLNPWRDYLANVFEAAPILSSSVVRRWGVGPPHYRLGGTGGSEVRDRVRDHDGRFCVHDERGLQASPLPPRMQPINRCHDLRRGQLLYVDLFEAEERGWILFTWAHMLFDGTGAEMFVRRLQEGWKRWRRGDSLQRLFEPSRQDPLAEVAREHSLLERLRTTRDWGNALVDGFPSRVDSPGGRLSDRDQRLDWNRVLYPEKTSRRIQTVARERSGHLQPMTYYLAVSMRAHHEVLQGTGSDHALLVPVAVDMRTQDLNPLYRTHASFFWFFAHPGELADLDALIEHLQEQRKSMIKENFHRRTAVAMETVRWYPTSAYRTMIRRPFDGQIASFFFSYTGAFLPQLDEFLGAPVQDGFHLPSVPVSPGSSLIWSTRNKKVNYTHVYQSDLFDEEARDRLHTRIHRDLPVGKPDHRSPGV